MLFFFSINFDISTLVPEVNIKNNDELSQTWSNINLENFLLHEEQPFSVNTNIRLKLFSDCTLWYSFK
jgi:hypothetical protein